ncbi:uncharacterized protein FIBRA_06225 [Fibroporia radiculosa]|uniref:Spo12 family protein n=1 Tax=Fibroporia radiculosa TaxID=599839 RepID=J4IB54_9APHY|nr:uncharacterized protein FIBRA_06225 [Fibroporia radiculosa]CCM04066.1 predicted protein [Fibroporia radiculosa]
MHNPSQAAHVVVPQAPLGNATNGLPSQAPGMGAKALLAKKFATHNPKYVSPTDKMMTPVSQKLSAAKKKHFTKAAKPMQSLFSQREADSTSSDSESPEDAPDAPRRSLEDTPRAAAPATADDDDENPF